MKNEIWFYVKYGILIVLLLSIQSTSFLSIFDIAPDLILILTLIHNLYFGGYKGMFFGFFMGIAVDSMSGIPLGLNSFVLTFISWFLDFYRKYIFVSDIFSFSLFIIIATIMKYALYILFYWIFRIEILGWYLLLKLAGEIFYNVIIGIPMFFLLPYIFRKRSTLI
ncbi:MAG: rod shape-determining protein MreD [Brevinematia bacterium]